MNTRKIPLWASKTCGDCEYQIDGVCRRQISSYGYPKVQDNGKYRPACSFYEEQNEHD